MTWNARERCGREEKARGQGESLGGCRGRAQPASWRLASLPASTWVPMTWELVTSAQGRGYQGTEVCAGFQKQMGFIAKTQSSSQNLKRGEAQGSCRGVAKQGPVDRLLRAWIPDLISSRSFLFGCHSCP